MVQRGDTVPHFRVTTLQAGTVQYSTIWQRRNLVLITLPPSDSESSGKVRPPARRRNAGVRRTSDRVRHHQRLRARNCQSGRGRGGSVG